MRKLFGLILLLSLSNYSHAGLGSMGGGFSPNIDFSGVGSGPPNIVDLGLCPSRSYMTCGGTRDGSNSSTGSSVYDTKPLIFQVRVTPKSLKVELPFTKTQSRYNIEVDWGDGSAKSKINSYSDVDRFHTYSTEGDYTITMRGRADWMAL